MDASNRMLPVPRGLVLSCCFSGNWPHDLNVLIVEVWVLFTALTKAFHSRGKRVQSDLLPVLNNSTKGEQFDEAVAKINYRVLMLRPYFVDTDIRTTELSHPARVNPLRPVSIPGDQNDDVMPRGGRTDIEDMRTPLGRFPPFEH